MAEKTLNTRIKLRYASYSEWQSSTLTLLPGEVALCYVETNNSEVKNSAPTVLFKVGDGSHSFKDLQWASARAADVYDWAKAENLEIERAGSGNVVASITWDDVNKKFIYQTTSVATSESFEDLHELVDELSTNLTDARTRLATAEGKISTLESQMTTKLDKTTFDQEKEALQGSINANTAAITTLNGDANTTGSVAKAVKDAIDQEVSDRNTAIDNEKSAREAADAALSSRIKVYEDNKDTYALKSEVESSVNAINGSINTIRENITSINSAADALEDRVSANESDIATLVGSDEGKSARTIANEELTKQLIPSSAQESLDTLQEIAAWIQDHPGDAAEMNDKISLNTQAIAKLNGAETIEGSVAHSVKQEADRAKEAEEANASAIETIQGYFDNGVAKNAQDAEKLDGHDSTYFAVKDTVDDALEEVNGKLATTQSDLTKVTTRVTTAEGEIDTLQGEVSTLKSQVSTISSDLDAAEADITTIKGDYLKAADKSELNDLITAEANRAKGEESKLSARIKTIEDDYLKSTDTLILDCGSYN